MLLYLKKINNYLFLKLKNINIKRRTLFYSFLFGSFGKETFVYGKIYVYHPLNISIGKNASLNEGVLLNARDKIIIGDFVHISPFCLINTGGLDYNKKMGDRGHIKKEVIIEDGVWLGSGVIVNPGVKIGRNSVVGAGSVVSRDIPENSVAVGVPAKVIKTLPY